MLPDLAPMIGLAVPAPGSPAVAQGVRLHHATDAAFHGAPSFVALVSEAGAELRAAGVGRGGARAVAHVGTELLLDGLLLDDRPGALAYIDALRAARPRRALLSFAGGAEAERFELLRGRLAARGLPRGYAEPDIVSERLAAVLQRRPRLRLSTMEQGLVRAILPGLRARLARALPALMDELRGRLLLTLARPGMPYFLP